MQLLEMKPFPPARAKLSEIEERVLRVSEGSVVIKPRIAFV